MVRPAMTRRQLLALVCGVVFFCGVVAPWAGTRSAETRAIEAAVHQTVTLLHYAAARAAAPAGLPPAVLERMRQEPGIEAVWMTDAQGAVLARAGHVGEAETAVARMAIGATTLVARDVGRRMFQMALRYTGTDGVVRGAVGFRIRPDRAAAALGTPGVLLWYWIGCAAIGTLAIGWALRRYRPAAPARSPVPMAQTPHRDRAASVSADPDWAVAVADCFPQPVLVLDGGQRIVAANTAATQRPWWPGAQCGRHLLDLADRVPWGRALVDCVDSVMQGSAATVHHEVAQPDGALSLSVARCNGPGLPGGLWVVVHEGERPW